METIIKDVILSDFEASKKTDRFKNEFLKVIISEMTYNEKKGVDYSKDNIAIAKLLKKFKEGAEEILKAFIMDEKTSAELAILKTYDAYLPKIMTKEEIADKIVELPFRSDGAPTIKDMGRLIKEFNAMYPGQNGKLVSELVREYLNK